MNSTGMAKFETARVALSYRESEITVIIDESLIPEIFMREKKTYEPNKVEIKAAIKSGQDVPGATVETRLNLQIK